MKMTDVQAKNAYINLLFTGTSSKIIFTCRSIVIRDKALKDTHTILTQNIIDLHSDDLSLSKLEKIQMLEHYIRGIEGNNVDTDKISNLNCSNFPFLCSIYAKNKQYQSKGWSFFDNMFPILQEDLDHLRSKSPCKYIRIIQCVILANENRELDIKTLPDDSSLQTRRLAEDIGLPPNLDETADFEDLFNVYLTREGNTVKFLHDTLFEAVVYHFGKNYPTAILKWCSPAFIREHVRVEEMKTSMHAIPWDRKYNNALASRFIRDIRGGHFHDTFLNETLKEVTILKCIKDELNKMSPNKVRTIFLENIYFQTESVITKKGAWDINTSVYKILEEQNVRPIHWILAFHHFQLFDYLLPNISNNTSNGKRSSQTTKKNNQSCSKYCLIPFACLSGNTTVLNTLLSEGKFGTMKDVWGDRKLSTLHMAVLSGKEKMVNEVLKFTFHVDVEDSRKRTPLFYAAAAGLSQICRFLIRRGANVNTCTQTRETPLFIASQEGHADVVKLLLRRHSAVSACRDDGASPLFIAIYNKHIDVAKSLVEHGSDINSVCVDGLSCLHAAARVGSMELIRFLLEHNAIIGLNKSGETPLIDAVRYGFTDIVTILLEHNVDIQNKCSADENTPINVALENENEEIFHMLLQHGSNIEKCNMNGESLLYQAAKKGLTGIVETLLKLHVDPNKVNINGISPLWIAVSHECTSTVETLLQFNANVDLWCKEGKSPLLMASSKGNLRLVKILVQNNATVNLPDKDGKTALFVAAENGNDEIVSFLLQNGADINKTISGGWSSLHASIKNGHGSVVNTLLNHGADVSLCSDDGSSPLCLAAAEGYRGIDELIRHGAEVNWTDKYDRTPLFCAAGQGHLEIVRKLVRSHADVNFGSKVIETTTKNGVVVRSQNIIGFTALHIASYKGHDDVVLSLQRSDADINACTENGYTPLMMATWQGNTSTVKTLLRLGADFRKRDSHGEDAYSMAIRRGQLHIAVLLNHKLMLNRSAKGKKSYT